MSMALQKAVGAMKRNDWIILTEMLDKGELSKKDLNNDRYFTLLTYAAEKGQVAIVDRLLLAGAYIECRDKVTDSL